MGNLPSQLSRRTLLRWLAGLAPATVLAACTPARRPVMVAQPQLVAARHGLPSPGPTPPTNAVDEEALTPFLAFSALLTGVDQLDPAVGRLYLAAMQASAGLALPELYSRAGVGQRQPPTLEELTASGFFTDEATRSRADQLIEMWYTGKYTDGEGNPVVATHTAALAWQVLDFTKATTLCGAPNFWAEPAADAVW